MIPQILYDDRNVSRYEPLMNELKRQGIKEYKIWSPVYCKNSVVESISLSQKQIVQWAKDFKQKEICLMEDDVMFPNENGWQYFLDKKPKEYDVYIGGSYFIDNRIEYASPLVKVNEWVGNHCIIINERYYDKFLCSPTKAHIDQVQKGMGEFYLCFPMAALQRPNRSANNSHQLVNYNTKVPKEYIYQ